MSLSCDRSFEVPNAEHEDSRKFRPAKEVFLFMHPTVRISRNIRALWFFDRLHKRIKIGPDQYEKSSQIEVVGIVPEDGIESPDEEEFVITENTTVTYMSHLYRLVFVLDMSPSTFVVESSGSVMQLRVIESLRRSLESVTREFRYPGSSHVLRPKVYISICVFSPFIAVAGDHVLLQGVLLNSENLEHVMDTVKKKLDLFLATLWTSANTQLCTWNAERRRMRSQQDGLASLVYNESTTEYSSRGYVQPEWALVFMLRMGLLGVQMLPENTQSNIIVITDGVVGMPNAQALAQLLTQLRSFTVSCSFLQLTPPLADDSVFGNFSSPELLNFLAMATFGTYIYDQKSIPETGPLELNRFHRAFLCWSFQRALASNDFIFDFIQAINPEFAKLSNRDNVKRVYKKNRHFTSLENLLYVRLREGYTVRRVQLYQDKVIYAKTSSDDEEESFEVDRQKETTYILVELRLPWKPLVFINYDIKLPWNSASCSSKREFVQIEVSIEAPFHLLKDFLSDEKFSSEQRQNSVDALKSSMHSVMQADRLLLHIHKFNTDPQYYTIPGEVTEAFSLFTSSPDQSIAVSRDMQMKNPKFVEFWYLVCGMDEGIWQKWVHTHTIRLILAPDLPLPKKLFTGNSQLSVRSSYTKVHDLLKSMTSFTLVQFQSYIRFVFGPENPKVPKYFYIVRTSQEGPCVILKIAFLGGIGAPDRKRVEEELKRQLTIMAVPRDLHYAPTNKFPEFNNGGHYGRRHSQSYSVTKKEQLAVTIVTKPLERILIRYKGFPKSYGGIVRLEDETHVAHIREIVLHNSVAKYMVCRRRVWCISRIFEKAEMMSFEAAEYILQVVLQRHLGQGFKIAHAENGVVTLGRQSARQTIEQFVIFPPSGTMTGYNDTEPAKEHEMFMITEMWTEPDSSFEQDEVTTYRMTTERVEKDADLIAVLTTFDQLTRACETHLRSCIVFKIASCKDRKPFEQLNHSVAVSHSSFDLCILLKHSTEKHLLLFPAIGFNDSDPKSRDRLSNLLYCLHCEMTSVSDICLDVTDGTAWYEMVEDLEYHFDDTESVDSKPSKRGNSSCKMKNNIVEGTTFTMRIYVSRISPWRLIVVVIIVGVDDVLEVTSHSQPSIPVLVFHLDEPIMAKRIASCDLPNFAPWHIDDFRGRKENVLAILNQQIQENKYSDENVIESCWFQQGRAAQDQGIFNTLCSFSAYCDIIEEKVFSRAFVAAVFSSLMEEVYVPEEIFREAMEDRSDHTTIAVDGISKIQAAVCSHIDYMAESINVGDSEDLDDFKSDKPCGHSLLNIDYLLQKYNFKPVPNMPTYFFYCPTVEPKQTDELLNTMCIEAVELTTDSGNRSRTLSQTSIVSGAENNSPSLVNESTNSENGCEEFTPCEDRAIAEGESSGSVDEQDEESDERDEEESCESSNGSSFSHQSGVEMDFDTECCPKSIDSYWSKYLDVCPLFVQFSCTVKSLEGSIVNFPLSRLPYCLSECFDMRRSTDMLGSEITIDMYVLTWAAPLSTISDEYIDELQFRDYNSSYDYNYNRMYESQFSFRMEEDIFERSVYTKTSLMENLPDRERSIVLQLQAGLENLIESERLLFLSRKKAENATKANINAVVDFVKSAKSTFMEDFVMLNPKSPPFVNVLYKEYSCKFVVDWAVGIVRLLRLLDGHVICANSYELESLSRRKKEKRLYLYCDAVPATNSPESKKNQFFNCDRQDEWIVEQERQSSVYPDEECHHFNDFWLVIKAEKVTQKIGIYLCQRHSMINDVAYEELRLFIKKSVRQTNQEILLERLHMTLTCDALLVPPSVGEVAKEKLDSLSSEDDFEAIPDRLPELVDDRFRNFRTGYFACEMVWSHWFEIHPRLIAARLNGESAFNAINAPAALLALTIGLEQLAVRNRKNLFVFLDDAGNSYYLRLHTDAESFEETCSSTAAKGWLKTNIDNFNTSILLCAYGVNDPNEQISVGIRDVLKKRLDQRVMEEIVYSFAKNSQAHLSIPDVCFIQPEGSEPFSKVYFTIPTVLNEFLGSYAFFLKQLLLTFSVTPRIREKSGSSRKSSVATSSSVFMPYLARSSQAEFRRIQESSAFFLVVKPAASGSRNIGLALIDVSFVEPDGNPKDLPRPPEMLLTKVRHIYPATGSRSRAGHISQELTKTRTVTSLTETKMVGVGALVQCAIWQVGDVGLEELQEKVRVSVQQALCDVVTEYGLLSSLLCDSSPTPFSPGFRNVDAPQRTSLDVHRHHSSDQSHQHSISLQQLPKRSSSGSASPGYSGTAQLQRASTATMFPFNGPSHSQPPTVAPSSVCGECDVRVSDGEDSDRVTYNGLPKTSVAKLQQKTSLDSVRRRPSGPAPMDCLQMNFVVSMTEWFDHVVKELSKLTTVCKSVKKAEFNLDCDVAASKLVQVIFRELTKVIPQDKLTIYASHEADTLKSGRRFQPVSPEDIATFEYQDLGHVLTHVHETIDIILIGYEKMHYNLKDMHSPHSVPDSVRSSQNKSTEAYQMHMPAFNSSIPRQRLLYLVNSGEMLTLYMYNYVDEIVAKVQTVVDTAVSWINARSWLLRGIGLQKMGIVHLNSISKSKADPNPYMPLTWMNPKLLVECDYPKPHMRNIKIRENIPHEEVQIFFRTYRNSELAFAPRNLNENSIFYGQTSQMLKLRSELLSSMHKREYLTKVHKEMMTSDVTSLEDEVFREFMARSRDVHFVKTPILLLKGWRMRIGEIRAAGNVAQSYARRKLSIATSNASTTSGCRKRSTPQGITTEEDPAIYRIQYMLVKDYIDYLKSFGFKVVTIREEDEKKTCCEILGAGIIFHPEVTVAPNFWMYMPLECGIVFCNLFFFKPYFGVRFFVWNCNPSTASTNEPAYPDENSQRDDLGDPDDDDTINCPEVELEAYKNLIISKSHVHSFTYDFHLRTVSTYLMGEDQFGIFSNDFDAEGFLTDFLKYYEGRPPNARNCVYEDQLKYDQLEVPRSEIFDYFLNDKLAACRKEKWKTMRLRAHCEPISDAYMLISREEQNFSNAVYGIVRVVILNRPQEHRERSPRNIVLKFYVILITADSVFPMADASPEESNDDFEGEFKQLESFPEEEEDEFGAEDDLFASRGDLLMTTSVYDRSDNSQEPVRRRFCSGDTALMNARRKRSNMMMRRRTSTDAQTLRSNSAEILTSSDSDLANAAKRQTKIDFLSAELSPSASKVSIQRIPPRRHRKSVNRSDRERQSIVAREQVTYMHYISPRQQLLQGFLEDSTSHCKQALQKMVSEADWYCRRDTLWTSLFSSTSTDARSMTNSIVGTGRLDVSGSAEPRTTIGQVTNTEMSSNELEALMNMSALTALKDEIPNLCDLLKTVDKDKLFTYVVDYFAGRCRFFDHSKKCVLIIDPNNVFTVAVLLRYDPKKDRLELLTMYKDPELVTDTYSECLKADEVRLIHEVSTCLMSYIWADLLQNPLATTGPKQGSNKPS